MPALKSPEVFIQNKDSELRTYFQVAQDIAEDPENLNGDKVMMGQLGLNPLSNRFQLRILPTNGEPVITMAMYLYEPWDRLGEFTSRLAARNINAQITQFGNQTSITVSGIEYILSFQEVLRGEDSHIKLEIDELSCLPAHPELSGLVVDEAIRAYREGSKNPGSSYHIGAYRGHDWQP